MKQIRTWEEADAVMADYRSKQNALAVAKAKLDLAIEAAARAYSVEASEAQADADAIEKALEKFAKEHKAEFAPAKPNDPESGRSHEHAGIVIGFRKHPDSVKVPKDQSLAAEQLFELYGSDYVHVEKTIDKAACLKFLKVGEGEVQDERALKALAMYGVTLKKGTDKFFIETKETKA